MRMKNKVVTKSKNEKALKAVMIAAFIFALFALSGMVYYFQTEAADALSEVSQLKTQQANIYKNVYVAIDDITAGDVLTDGVNITLASTYNDFDSSCYYYGGSGVAAVDIPYGFPILKSMVADESPRDDMREVEYTFIDITDNVDINDYVDVRIQYPDGTSYIIAAKKRIVSLSEDRLTVDLWVTEEEYLLMDSAVVDAVLYEGSTIEVTKYIEPTLQAAAATTYVPSVQSATLIKSSPNLVSIASTTLSSELRAQKEKDLQIFASDEDDYDENGNYTGGKTLAETIEANGGGSDSVLYVNSSPATTEGGTAEQQEASQDTAGSAANNESSVGYITDSNTGISNDPIF